jgi:hypothetical protein
MTRKDYEVIGVALAQAYAEASGKEWEGVKKCIEHISHALQVDNERFQPSKFVKFIQHECDRMVG